MEGGPFFNHSPITPLPNRGSMFFPNDLWLTPLFSLDPTHSLGPLQELVVAGAAGCGREEVRAWLGL